jgi:hypothetical protein
LVKKLLMRVADIPDPVSAPISAVEHQLLALAGPPALTSFAGAIERTVGGDEAESAQIEA